MRTRARLPDLSNATAGGIVDMCAPDTEEMNRLKKVTDYLKTGLKARITEEMRINSMTHLVEGEKYTATITESQQTRLSNDQVRAMIDDLLSKGIITNEDLDKYNLYNSIEMTTIRFEKNPPLGE